MKRRMTYVLCAIFILSFLSGCAAHKAAAPWGNASSGFLLEYRLNPGDMFTYESKSQGVQSIDIPMMGSMEMTSMSDATIVHKIAKLTGDVVTHDLSFTALKMEMNSDQGSENLSPGNVLNKSLFVETDRLGRDISITNDGDFPALEGQTPVEIGLLSILLEFSGTPVKMNDSWTSTVRLDFDKGRDKINSRAVTDYTLLGEEKRMGYDCLKINGETKIELSGTMTMQGQAMDMAGTGKATSTYYYAYKESILIEVISETAMDMSADIPGIGAIPIISNEKGTVKLVK